MKYRIVRRGKTFAVEKKCGWFAKKYLWLTITSEIYFISPRSQYFKDCRSSDIGLIKQKLKWAENGDTAADEKIVPYVETLEDLIR